MGARLSTHHLYENIQDTNTIETIYRLIGLNILLESGMDTGVEQAALEHYVRPELRSGSRALLPEPQPNYRFIFNRVSVLLALKSELGIGVRSDPLAPNDEYPIGDLILRANEFISGDSFQTPTSVPTALQFAAETIPTWDLTNPRDLAYGMARIYRMIEHLAGGDPIVLALRAKIGIVPSALRFGDLLLDEFLAIAFGLYSYVKSIPPAILLKSGSDMSFKSDQVLAGAKFPAELVERFLAKTSIGLGDLQKRFEDGSPWNWDHYLRLISRPDFRSDFLPLRERPLLIVEDDKYVVADVQFLAELLHSGIYFDLLFSLPFEKREDFMSLWGRIFELSLFELLQDFYPDSAGILKLDLPFLGGQIDALLDFGDVIVIFEFKHFLLPHGVKFGRDAGLLESELKKKLFANQKGKPKAIRQLTSVARAIRSGTVETLLGKQNSSSKAALYPVIVVADASLEAPFCKQLPE